MQARANQLSRPPHARLQNKFILIHVCVVSNTGAFLLPLLAALEGKKVRCRWVHFGPFCVSAPLSFFEDVVLRSAVEKAVREKTQFVPTPLGFTSSETPVTKVLNHIATLNVSVCSPWVVVELTIAGIAQSSGIPDATG